MSLDPWDDYLMWREDEERRAREEEERRRRALEEEEKRRYIEEQMDEKIAIARDIRSILDDGGDPSRKYGRYWRDDLELGEEIERTGTYYP